MLGASEEKLIKSLLPEMAAIINAIPGEVFTSKEADTFMAVARRLPDSELKVQVSQFSEIFGRQRGAGICDITNSMIAYVRIKVLVEAGESDFDGISYRELIKECRAQIDRTRNIIRLSKANAMTAEEFQKDKIHEAIRKNEAFISCFENEIRSVEKKLERIPLPFEPEDIVESLDDVAEAERPKEKTPKKRKSIVEHVEELINAKKDRQYVDEHLRNEEKRQASTMCEEIPYYENRLSFTECLPCKDLGAYCILKKKDNVYFGLNSHVSKGIYVNEDQSLIELTNVSEEFIQLMTEDVLNGEFKLQAFSDAEKKSLQMYLDFVTHCFEKYIGVTLNAQEYLAFKGYYNRLVDAGMMLELQSKENYYRAIPLAEQYMYLMDVYNMIHSEKKAEIIKQISLGANERYLDSLELILDNHMFDEAAKGRVKDLAQRIRFFLVPEMIEEEETNGIVISVKDFEEAKIKIQCQNADCEVVDEAVFASSNLKQAVDDYMTRKVFIKKIGLMLKDKEVYLYGAREGALSICLLTEKKKQIRGLSEGVTGQMVDFYLEQINKLMTDYVEVE